MLDGKFKDNPPWYVGRVVTVHPLGGCPMGRNEREGVVDSYGQVFGYPGFVIADGSVMPGPVGPNPSNTISALAHRFAERSIRGRVRRSARRTADERLNHWRKIMRQRLPLILSSIALVVALLGSTPLGRAAESALEQVVPRAKRADFAANAGKLNGHKSSVNPTRGQIPVVGANGKLAASIGAVGPKGDPGPQGPQGGPGVSGYLRVSENITVPDADNGTPDFGVSCPGGRAVLGGGWRFEQNQTRRAEDLRVARGQRLDVAVQDQQRDRASQADDAVRGLRQRRLVGRRAACRVEADDAHYSIVAERLGDGEIVPFLGAGANLCDRPDESRLGARPLRPERRRARRRSSPRAAGTRTPTSTSCACRSTWTRSSARASLYSVLHDVFDSNYPPTSVHRFFARLPALLRRARPRDSCSC